MTPSFPRLLPIAALLAAALWLATAAALAEPVTGTVQVRAGRSLEGSLVWLVPAVRPAAGWPVPPPAVMDQRLQTFAPHVLVVRKGQQVDFPNTDIIRHNVFSPSSARPFNLGIYPPGQRRSQTFDTVGVVALLCNVHAQMSAFIVVVDTPHFSVTDSEGRFAIAGVPAGKYQAFAWHEGLVEATRSVELPGGALHFDLQDKK